MDAKQKEATNAALKWQNELAEANAKINQLTKKGKSLNEELTQNRKESHEVQQSKYSDNQKVERVTKMSCEKIVFNSKLSFKVVNFGLQSFLTFRGLLGPDYLVLFKLEKASARASSDRFFFFFVAR